MRALPSPPRVIVVSGSQDPQAKEEALANAFAFVPAPLILAELDHFVTLALAADKGNG